MERTELTALLKERIRDYHQASRDANRALSFLTFCLEIYYPDDLGVALGAAQKAKEAVDDDVCAVFATL